MSFTHRFLTENDSAVYNAFLECGTRKHPNQFRITPDEVLRRPFSSAPNDDRCVVVFEDSSGLVATGALERELGRVRRAHVGWVYRMYVEESFAGQGLGGQVLEVLINHAREVMRLEQLNLTVISTNERAIRLYERFGFRRFASEPKAIRHEGFYLDEDQMKLML
jgi:RimJ/RimL family protein N-acetyltransferase